MLYYRNKRTYKFMREPYATLWPNLVLVIAEISKSLMAKSAHGMYDIKELHNQLRDYNPSFAYIVAVGDLRKMLREIKILSSEWTDGTTGEKRIGCFYPYPVDLVRKAARESEAWDRYIEEL